MNLSHASVKITLDIYASDHSEARRSIAQQTAAAIGATHDDGKTITAVVDATPIKRPTLRVILGKTRTEGKPAGTER